MARVDNNYFVSMYRFTSTITGCNDGINRKLHLRVALLENRIYIVGMASNIISVLFDDRFIVVEGLYDP